MFASQSQAKRFFIDRITAQAEVERQPLSADEQWMLGFSESDPEFVFDAARVSALEADISDAEYEGKVAGLAERACSADLAANPEVLATYKEAFRVLKQGDHYILIMLEIGLARWLRPWWALLW